MSSFQDGDCVRSRPDEGRYRGGQTGVVQGRASNVHVFVTWQDGETEAIAVCTLERVLSLKPQPEPNAEELQELREWATWTLDETSGTGRHMRTAAKTARWLLDEHDRDKAELERLRALTDAVKLDALVKGHQEARDAAVKEAVSLREARKRALAVLNDYCDNGTMSRAAVWLERLQEELTK